MLEIIEKVTLATIPAFLILDFFISRQAYPKPKFWRLRAFAVTAAIFVFSGEVAVFWGKVFGDAHLFDASALGTLGGAALGVLVYELCHYWYHRSAHRWNWLWRAGHQMHHSAESLDAFGAYYGHPFDAAMFTTLASLVFFPLLGLSIGAAVVANLFLTFNAMFQHANIRTPRWLGYVIQRPESHNVHHGRRVHRYNYSDLPLWDMVFGTFKNPAEYENEACGFYDGASSRIFDMLLGRDVSKPRPAAIALPRPLETGSRQ